MQWSLSPSLPFISFQQTSGKWLAPKFQFTHFRGQKRFTPPTVLRRTQQIVRLKNHLIASVSNIVSRVSSGGIVSDHGLDDRAIGVRSPAGAEDFSSSLCVQTGSGAHPASCTMGTGGPFPGGKARPGRDAYSSPSGAEVDNE
jgi:hypothetical protein